MAGPIRLFVSFRRFYQMLGIDPSQVNPKWGLNWKNLFFLYSLAQMFVLTMAFCLCEAKTIFDYGSSAFIGITVLACFIAYLLQYFEMVNTLNWINKIDELIEKSK